MHERLFSWRMLSAIIFMVANVLYLAAYHIGRRVDDGAAAANAVGLLGVRVLRSALRLDDK